MIATIALATMLAQVTQPNSKALDACAEAFTKTACTESLNTYFKSYKEAAEAEDVHTACQSMLYGLGVYFYLGGIDVKNNTDPTTDANYAVSLMDEIEDDCEPSITNKVDDIIDVIKQWKKGDPPIEVLAKNIIEGHPVEKS